MGDLSDHFSKHELACRHCGELGHFADSSHVQFLELLRADFGWPLKITSGYRCQNHPVEIAKPTPGAHFKHQAVDIAVYGVAVAKLTGAAFATGYRGFGFSQRDPNFDHRFLHLDRGPPRSWSY